MSGWQALPPPWDPERDDTLICCNVRQETSDSKTFVFAPPEPRLFRFSPGQFMTFDFDLGGRTVSRCYTIASPPTRPDRCEITVKHKAGGEVSPWLHTELRPGVRVRASVPMGDFWLPRQHASKYLFLSAGSGITPMMSMARALDDLGSDADVIFLHGARTPDDIIFRRELEVMAKRRARFRLAFHCSGDFSNGAWHGLRGRLSEPMLQLLAPDFRERETFLCGPEGYMAAARTLLIRGGLASDRLREESFAFGATLDHVSSLPGNTSDAGQFRVSFVQSGRSVACSAEEPILTAAQKAGMRLPSSCTRGVCGTCRSRLVEGRVDMRHGGGIRQREIDQGFILICCSRPLTDVTIDR